MHVPRVAMLLAMIAAVACHGAPEAAPDRVLADTLAARRYRQYLDAVLRQPEPEGSSRLAASFAALASAAVAVAKLEAAAEGQRVAALLAATPDAARWWRALCRVLAGDLPALAIFFGGAPPPYADWAGLAPLLEHHGYEEVARAARALYMTGHQGMANQQDPAAIQVGVAALLGLAEGRWQLVLTVLAERVADDWHRRAQIATEALAVMRREPTEDERAAQVAARLAHGTGTVTLAEVARLLADQRDQAAERLLPAALEREPGRSRLMWFLAETRRVPRPSTVQRLLACTSAAVPSPWNRSVRLALLRAGGRAAAPAALIAADRLGLAGGRAGAATAYRALALDEAVTGPWRLDAWAGWLSAEPEQALRAWPQVAGPQPSEQAAQWWAWSLWDLLTAEPPTQTAWATQAAEQWLCLSRAVQSAVLEGAAPADRARHVVAVVLALAGRAELAATALLMPVSVSIPPPPGGWLGPPGAPAPPDALMHRTAARPAPGAEAEPVRAALLWLAADARRLAIAAGLAVELATAASRLTAMSGDASFVALAQILNLCSRVTLHAARADPDCTAMSEQVRAAFLAAIETCRPVPARQRALTAAHDRAALDARRGGQLPSQPPSDH